jgi:hypothetical protein
VIDQLATVSLTQCPSIPLVIEDSSSFAHAGRHQRLALPRPGALGPQDHRSVQPHACSQLRRSRKAAAYRFPTPLACRSWSKWPRSPEMGIRSPQMSHHDDEEPHRSQTA